jgi:hypothetical protein
MRGHEPILETRRRQGLTPAMVWIEADGYIDGFTWLGKIGARPEHHVELAAKDSPVRCDMRFTRGLVCMIEGSDEHRVAAVARACIEAGAKQVIAAWATTVPRGEEFETTTHRITFTNEELSQWPT